jgi:hypothetical protein
VLRAAADGMRAFFLLDARRFYRQLLVDQTKLQGRSGK